MRTFKYFSIYSKDGNMQVWQLCEVLTEELILQMTNHPACSKMGIEQRFLFLLSKWNAEQFNPTIRYFYGPLQS